MYSPFHRAVAEIVASIAGVDPASIKLDTPPKAALGDFAVGCFAIAKARQKDPKSVASEIAAAVTPTDLVESATAAGPFVNFKLRRAEAFRQITAGVPLPQPGAGETVVIDYSSPNISKHLAYHHIRSTMLGHALVQIYRALGYRVVGVNHLGDWGTTHGMLIAAYIKWGAEEPLDVTKLNDLYVKWRAAEKDNPALEAEARAWFKRLEDGDVEARKIWSRFRDISLAEYQTVYDALGIQFEEVRGESAYEGDMPRVMDELKGLLVESEGAQVVTLDGEDTPILIRKGDGTTLYATRDVATAEYRWNTYHPAKSLYVVDRGQSLHFRQLFKLLAKMGHDWVRVCKHVPFGLVRVGGTKTGTRSGNVVLLKDVLAEAADKVRALIVEGNSALPADVLEPVSRMVGIGAVVFANVASQRERDVDFEWKRVISLQGDSGPYLQYSHARCASIHAKAGAASPPDFAKLTTDGEWAVARRLLDFPEHVLRATDDNEPHVICHYLLDLAAVFSRWYTEGNGDASLRVLVDDAGTRGARLALVTAVQKTLATGLSLLGIGAPDQM